jgi:hypothetical protein
MGIDLIWLGVLLAVNMQTSFMHPPFGFALFSLRSVAPKEDYQDKVTGKTIAKVSTGDIYWGSIPFICIQLIMVIAVLLYPGMVTHYKADRPKINIEDIKIDAGSLGNYGEGAYGSAGSFYGGDAGSSDSGTAAPGSSAPDSGGSTTPSDEDFNKMFK